MLILIAPAKTLDYSEHFQTTKYTIPEYIEKARELVILVRKLKPVELKNLLSINSELANLNFERFVKWQLPFSVENAKQALLVFKGEVYRGLRADKFTTDELLYTQDHLRILSALYGLLRPLDLMQPYRLEMGTKLKNKKGADLYQFWGNKVTESINKLIDEQHIECVVNLCSTEYFKVVKTNNLKARVVSPVFYETTDAGYKVIVVYTKKARGLMSNFILRNKITNPEELKLFDWEGYYFNPNLSDESKWVFCR